MGIFSNISDFLENRQIDTLERKIIMERLITRGRIWVQTARVKKQITRVTIRALWKR